MIPAFNRKGNLPSGIYVADWAEFAARFGGSPRRQMLLAGLKAAIQALQTAQCNYVYVDGSFVTCKGEPGDYDACYEIRSIDATLLDPVFLDFSAGRRAQKNKYGGEFFPAELPEGLSGKTFLNFFQTDRDGSPKGIVALDLNAL